MFKRDPQRVQNTSPPRVSAPFRHHSFVSRPLPGHSPPGLACARTGGWCASSQVRVQDRHHAGWVAAAAATSNDGGTANSGSTGGRGHRGWPRESWRGRRWGSPDSGSVAGPGSDQECVSRDCGGRGGTFGEGERQGCRLSYRIGASEPPEPVDNSVTIMFTICYDIPRYGNDPGTRELLPVENRSVHRYRPDNGCGANVGAAEVHGDRPAGIADVGGS